MTQIHNDTSRCTALCCASAEHCARFVCKPLGQWCSYTDFSDGLPRASCPMFIQSEVAR